MIAVIIPAHNEERVIGRSLASLLSDARPDELEVIVACNGCRDCTADVARRFGSAVQVLETPVASKVHALNLGDGAATAFPRLYLDADVRMTSADVRALANGLAADAPMAGSPVPQMDFSGASWAVRAFYRVWLNLPYVKEGMVGVGVYALNKAARARFETFPEIINDDGFIRALFSPPERPVIVEAWCVVTAPSTFAGLLKIMTRSRLGRYQLEQAFPELVRNERQSKSYVGAAANVLWRPLEWPAAAVYLLVNLITRVRARRQWKAKQLSLWERDETSRDAIAGRAGSAPVN